ncbi:MAG: hypothetical protein CMH57_05290 [Myxococcales bacterium]|nr:hypothetical protein [Myxococcales bacterium]
MTPKTVAPAIATLVLCLACADDNATQGGGGLLGPGTTAASNTPGVTCPDDPGGAILSPAPPAPVVLEPPDGCPTERSPEGICLPAPPTLPEAIQPMRWSCPTGWLPTPAIDTDTPVPDEVRDLLSEVSYCLPPDPPEGCPAGTTPRLGEAGCVRLGVECPEGRWHDDDTIRARVAEHGYDGAIWRVAPDADADAADGSAERPFVSVQAALDQAEAGDIVAIGVGEYDEAFIVRSRVALLGACVEGTILRAPSEDELRGTVGLSSSRGAWVGELTVTGDRRGIVAGNASEGAWIEAVHVHGATPEGVYITRSRETTLRDVHITDTRVASDGQRGSGLVLISGADASLERVAVERSQGTAVLIASTEEPFQTIVSASDLFVRGAPDDEAPDSSWGLRVDQGARLDGERIVLTRHRTYGALIVSSEATLTDFVVTHTRPSSAGTEGLGMCVVSGAVLDAERVALLHNAEAGLFAFSPGTEITMTDLTVQDTTATGEGNGYGVSAWDGTHMELNRAALLRNTENGLIASGVGTEAYANDVWSAWTRRSPSGETGGRGVRAQDGARFEETRLLLTQNAQTGLFVTNPMTQVTTTDLQVFGLDTAPAGYGVGLTVNGRWQGFRTQLKRLDIGLTADDASLAQVTDLTIEDGWDLEPLGGRGIQLVDAARLEGRRVALLRNMDLGLYIGEGGSGAVLSDLRVEGTRAAPNGVGGRGIGLEQGASLRGERIAVVGNQAIGWFMGGHSEADVQDLLIADTTSNEVDSDVGRGFGLEVQRGSAFTGARVALMRNNATGAYIGGDGALVDVTNLLVADTQANTSQQTGTGVQVLRGGTLRGARVALRENIGAGLLINSDDGFLEGDPARAELTDLVIERTLPREVFLNGGVGLDVRFGGVLEIARASLSTNHESGLLVTDAHTLATDLLIEQTRVSAGSSQRLGRGVTLQQGATLTGERVTLSGNHEVGLLVRDPGARAELTDLAIEATQPAANAGGTGLLLSTEASATLTRFRLTDNQLAGLQLSSEATLEATEGHVRDNFVGLNVQSDAFNTNQLVCVDIERNCCGSTCEALVCNVESSDLPIPDSSVAITELGFTPSEATGSGD